MTLREKIQESIINAGNNFYYDSEYSINRILDNATFPTAFMYLLQDSGIDRIGTQSLDKCNAQIVFSDLQDFDNTAITTDDIIEECILKAKFWLSTLQQNSNLELVQINSTKRIYSTFDVQLCGYLVNVQIRERYENKDCTNQPLTILEMLSQHTQQVATEMQLGHIRSGGDISVDENGIVTVLNGGGGSGGGVFIRRSFFTPPFTSYRGFAPENSLETDAVWTITKTVENANGTIFSNEQVFNHKWTEINTI